MTLVLTDFGVLAACWVAAGMLFILYAVTVGVGGVLVKIIGYIPFGIGKVLASPVNDVVQWLDHALGGAYQKVQGAAGWSFHMLAREVEYIGNAFRDNSNLLDLLARTLLGATLGGAIVPVINQHVRKQKTATVQAKTQAQHATRTAHKTAAQAVADALPQIRTRQDLTDVTVDRVAGRAVPVAVPGAVPIPAGHTGELPALREKVKAAEDAAGRAWKWVKDHRGSLVYGIPAAIVGVALGRLGAGWSRCSNWNRYGKGICRADPALIDKLLADTLVLLGTVSVVEFVRDAQAVESEAIDALRLFIRDFP